MGMRAILKVMRNTVSMLSLTTAVLLLGACAEEPARWEPEVEQCATIVGRTTEMFGSIVITKVHLWDVDTVRNVQLRFDYPPDMGDVGTGLIVCTYDYDPRGAADRIVKAQAVYYKGRYLDESELYYVNTSPFRPRPEFKISP